MRVLSLFDGMSCGQIALKELGITPEVYYASEIDKHAIGQTQLNFPNTIQIGSVVNVDVTKLQPIDLLLGGSPCQSFSFAGKQKGMATKCEIEILKLEQYLELKEQGFEFEGQSYLFWEYVRILTDIRKYNPNVLFLLENVEMSKKWERVLSEALGLFGVHINSALVSAQNRERIYWSNIRVKELGLFSELYTDIPQPEDLGIALKDILEDEVEEKYYLSEKMLSGFMNKPGDFGQRFKIQDENCINKKSACITQNLYKIQSTADFIRVKSGAHSGGNHSDMDLICERIPKQLNPSLESGGKQPYQQNRVYNITGVAPAVMANMSCGSYAICLDTGQTNAIEYKSRIRRLTPTEVARLQTIPDWYVWKCSSTQQYRMCGNGWTINVIKHILSFI